MVRIKICGITNPDDAVVAAEMGAAAIGIVLWPSSPRFVDRERARSIVDALPPFVSAVGVFVNQVEEAAAMAADLGLSAVQLHGDESADSYRGFAVPVIKSVAVHDRSAVTEAAAVPEAATVLLDAADPVRRGGTGRVVDWTIAAAIARTRRTILSGGLTPANVADAIAAVGPYAIDVSSGVESAPGRKDRARLRDLFSAVNAVVNDGLHR